MENIVNIPFRAMVDVGDCAIGASASFNGIFKLNYENHKIEYISSVYGEPILGGTLFCDAILYGSEVIFVPFCADCIAILNIKTMEISKCPLPQNEFRSIWKFSTVCRYKNKIFLIPGKYDYILSFDMETHKIERLEEWKALLSRDVTNTDDMLLAAGVIGTYGKRAYIQVMYTNILLVFNMEEGKVEDKIFLPEGSYTVATVYNDNVWIIPRSEGSIVKISLEDMTVSKYCDSPLKVEKGEPYASVRVLCKNDKLYMFPQGARGIGIVDLSDSTTLVDYAITNELYKKYGEYPRFFFIKENVGEQLFASVRYKKGDTYGNIAILLKDMKFEEISLTGTDEWKKKYLIECVNDNEGAVYDEKLFRKLGIDNSLETYVEYLQSIKEVDVIENTETVGNKIHNVIMRQQK